LSIRLPVDENGVVDLDMLATVIAGIDDEAKPRTLISIMAANNETGVIQPMDEIAAMAKSANIALHSDMVQIFGKRHINFDASKISYASLSAHKIGGPSGVGALLVRPGCRLSSLLRGGGSRNRGGGLALKIWLALPVLAVLQMMRLAILVIIRQWRNGAMILNAACWISEAGSRFLAAMRHGLAIPAVLPHWEKRLKQW
jgi:cysteine desulfurase